MNTLLDQSTAATRRLTDSALATLFGDARTANAFITRPVPQETLREVLTAANLGPTALNATPLRVVFVQTPQGKERLRGALMPGNVDKTMSAPVTAILAHDSRFYEHLPELFPSRDFSHIGNDAEAAREMARYNAALQAGYFIVAARAHGLDAGPMGGFDKEAVDREFFTDGRWKSELLVNLGYGDRAKLFPRNPRLPIDAIARFA